jgi:hypothetical protein
MKGGVAIQTTNNKKPMFSEDNGTKSMASSMSGDEFEYGFHAIHAQRTGKLCPCNGCVLMRKERGWNQ